MGQFQVSDPLFKRELRLEHGFGYFGRTTSESLRNETTMLGLDATIARGPLELNLQYLHRNDDRPRFEAVRRRTNVDGGFAELLVRPRGSRWHGFALYNLVNTTEPLLSLRLGEAEPLDRYETITGGVGYLLRRNFRITGEATHDIEEGGVRWALGSVSAF